MARALVKKDASPPLEPDVVMNVLIKGQVEKLTDQQRLDYMVSLCRSLGLNPMTRPFDFVKTKEGKLILYAKRDLTDQLRKREKVSITILSRVNDPVGQIISVEARASMPDGLGGIREDTAVGIVPSHFYRKKIDCGQNEQPGFVPLTGSDLANAMMKAETKAKRRVTLSILGIGITDESELDTMEVKPDEDKPPVVVVYATPEQVRYLEQNVPDTVRKKANVATWDLLPYDQAATIITEHASKP